MNNSHIYVVIGIDDIHPEDFLHPIRMTRCIGYFNTLDNAEHAILHDKKMPKKFFFSWFAIEETIPGFYQDIRSRIYYHWDRGLECYVQANEPKCLKAYPVLGIG